MNGAGSIWKKVNRPERQMRRPTQPVPRGYETLPIFYQASFRDQYGWKIVCCWSGAAACIALWAFAFSPWARVGDIWGLGPSLVFALAALPLMLGLPVWWYVRWRRLKDVFEGRLDDQKTPEVFE